MTAENDELSLLLTSLGSAVTALQTSLKEQALPSFKIDDPTPHPLDSGLVDPVCWYARKTIVGLCSQMIALVQSPGERMMTAATRFMLPGALNLLVESKVPDEIAKAGAQGEDVSTLAAKAGINAGKLRSVLRYLTADGYFKEVSAGRYALNRPSSVLVSDNPIAGFVYLHSGPTLSAMPAFSCNLRSSLSDKESTIETYHGMPIYAWLQNNPPYMRAFINGMRTFELYIDPGISSDYAWGDLGKEITLVDIGSGRGGLTLDLLKRFPGWKAILQDTEEVLESAKEFWSAHAPDMLESGRITFIPCDFLAPTLLPPSPEAVPYVFMLKHVLHNWEDGPCVEILRNLLPAAPPGSVALIIEALPGAVVPTSVARPTVEQYFSAISGKTMHDIHNLSLIVPVPLLPDFGWGSPYLAATDLLMLILFNSPGRTEAEYQNLLGASSWTLQSVTELRASTSVLKAIRN